MDQNLEEWIIFVWINKSGFWKNRSDFGRNGVHARIIGSRLKVHSLCKQCLHKDLVFINWQLMLALASLDRFGEEVLISINWRSCRHCLQNKWPLEDLIRVWKKESFFKERIIFWMNWSEFGICHYLCCCTFSNYRL